MLVCLIGFFAGIIGGMGMGGGTILIPALVLFANIDPKLAQSINLLSSIPMTLAALLIHIKNKKNPFFQTDSFYLYYLFFHKCPFW